MRRSIASCRAPPVSEGFLPPRNFFNSDKAPPFSPAMSKRPTRVSLTISGADMQHTTASQLSRRALIAGNMACACSSMNIIVTTMMSAVEMSLTQRATASGSFQSAAAWKQSSSPGISRCSDLRARSVALAK